MIKSLLKSLAATAFLLPIYTFAQGQTYFAAYPALTPDAQTIVFSYDGDIWKVPVKGGVASRVTANTAAVKWLHKVILVRQRSQSCC